MKLFLDTGSFIARELARDQYHEKAANACLQSADSQCKLFCGEHIFDECMTLLSRRHSYAFAAECGYNYLYWRASSFVVCKELKFEC